MRKVSLFIIALIVAAGAFWATMLTTSPTTEAAQPRVTINVYDLAIQKNLRMADPADAF